MWEERAFGWGCKEGKGYGEVFGWVGGNNKRGPSEGASWTIIAGLESLKSEE